MRLGAIAGLVAGSLAPVLAASAAPAQAPSPPIIVAGNYTLPADMTFSDSGIIVTADNVTVYLNGHTITGPGLTCSTCPFGAGVQIDGRQGVTVKNGTINGFVFGVFVNNSNGNVVTQIASKNNSLNGMSFFNNSDNNQVDHCQSSNNGASGTPPRGFGVIMNNGSDGNTVSDCTFAQNGASGVFIGGSPGNAPSLNNQVLNNVIDGSGPSGIQVRNSSNNTLRGNTVTHGAGLGIFIATGANNNQVRYNVVKDNAFAGIRVSGAVIPPAPAVSPPENNWIIGNQLSGNGAVNGAPAITDDTAGAGTAGTRNTYHANACATSSPPGLCGPAPTAAAGGPYNVPEGGSVALIGVGTDADGDALTFAWDLDNNGTFETAGQNPTFSAAGRDGPSSQIVRLLVCDVYTACATSQATVNIANVPPTADAGPDQAQYWGVAVSFSGSVDDVSAADKTAGLNPTWDFGDGSPAAAGLSVSHAYATPGTYTATLTGTDKDGGVGTSTAQVTINKRLSALAISSSNTLAAGSVLVQGVLTDGTTPVSGRTVTFTAGSVSATGTTDASGVATATLALQPGQHTLNAGFAGDGFYLAGNATPQTLYVYQPTSFVIWGGNQPALAGAVPVGQSFMFWGAQWAKQVTAGDYQGNASFKGYAAQVNGSTWTTGPGNSSNPPPTVGTYIGVIVATQITKNGNVISGDVAQTVVLRVDEPSAYQPNSGHEMSGVVVAIVQ